MAKALPRTNTMETKPPKRIKRWIIVLGIIIGIPILAFAYSWIDATLHSPEIIWALQKSKAEQKLPKAKVDAEQALESTLTVFKQAVTSQASDALQKYSVNVGKRSYINHGCQAITVMGGSKFNERPVGKSMKCVYAVAKPITVKGDAPFSFSTLIEETNNSQQTNIRETLRNQDLSLGTITYATDDYTLESLFLNYGVDWENIFLREWDEIQRDELRSTSIISAITTYYIFYDETL